MRRVDTFIASSALLDLLESPPLHPTSHSSAKRAKPSQEDPCFHDLVVDSSFLQAAVDSSFMEDEFDADLDLSGLVSEHEASSRAVSPLMLGPSLLANDLYTPSTQEVLMQGRDGSIAVPLARAGKLPAATPLKRTARHDDDKLLWQSQLSEALRRSDALTKSLVGSAATGEPQAVIDVLARLSPRQVDALRPAAVRDLVQERLSQMRFQMLRHFESRVAPSVLAMARESWGTRADEER